MKRKSNNYEGKENKRTGKETEEDKTKGYKKTISAFND